MKQPAAINNSTSQTEQARRFGGIERVYGVAGLANLVSAHVCVIGVGGVGSWAVESLARSAIGAITMIDMDVVSVSNINRQILATSDTLGRDKVSVLKERVQSINPNCNVNLVDDFIGVDNLSKYISPDFDFVIDCIDDYRRKAALISHCKRNRIPIITIGGAGGQIDPAKIRQQDLSISEQDVLLASTRKLLRQDYRFPRNLKKRFGVPCIFSTEQAVYPDGDGGLSPQRPKNEEGLSNGLSCAGGLGSITHVTATFGFFATAFVLKRIAYAD